MTIKLSPRFLALAVVAVVLLLSPAPRASAHPMGNFSINHYASITVGTSALHLLYVVDMAEIPTFQELSGLGISRGAELSRSQRVPYLTRTAWTLLRGLSLTFDRRPLPRSLQADDLLFPPGAGGLDTERLYLEVQAPLPRTAGTIAYSDANFPGRAGWKEIVTSSSGRRLLNSSATSRSRSAALTVYPTTLTSSPPQELRASVALGSPDGPAARLPSPRASIEQAEAPLFAPGGGWSSLAQRLAAVRPHTQTRGATGGTLWGANRSDPLSDLMNSRRLSLGVLLLSLIAAFWFGAAHALSPGHGKTMVAAYLVGSRGTAAQAAILGATVTVTHTAGVFALGFVTLYLSQFILPDQLYPWLGFISGALVALMGVALFVRRFRALRGRERETHGHHVRVPQQGNPHGHEVYSASHRREHPVGARAAEHAHARRAHHRHSHDHDHDELHRHGLLGLPHRHGPPQGSNGERVSLRSLLALGVSGGLLPCPSALVVLLSAIAFHRVAFGIVLILAFSTGLATTLTGIGLVTVYSTRLVGRVRSASDMGGVFPALRGAVRVLPVASSLFVATLGAFIAMGALSPGLLPSVLGRL